jgi:hypothetical protein
MNHTGGRSVALPFRTVIMGAFEYSAKRSSYPRILEKVDEGRWGSIGGVYAVFGILPTV